MPDIKVFSFQKLNQQPAGQVEQPTHRQHHSPEQQHRNMANSLNGTNNVVGMSPLLNRTMTKQTSTISSIGSSESSDRSRTSSNTDNEVGERQKMCGTLFERKPIINQEIFDEFFRREPCLYNQKIYKNAARIFHCLKANLNENPILKSLKQQQSKENGEEEEKQITEVPKINYDNNAEKKKTLELAFSTLKFQRVLEELVEECQLYVNYQELKDEQSLVCTILFDYMKRKFQLRDKLIEEPYDNGDELITYIENVIYKEKTDLAAELARNRIKADALTLEELLPKEIREVDQHKAELPLYCWVNQLKTSVQDVIDHFIQHDDLILVESKKLVDRKCFIVDSHCPSLIMFHFALRDRIMQHDLVKQSKLIIQDKSSCLAPYSVVKLLSKKDDVIVTNISGGLVAAFIACMMEELEGKVYVYGAENEDKYQEISHKMHQIGCSKYVKIVREDFLNSKTDDGRLDNVKVILINAPCSKTALMNPMEFLFQEGEDVRFLRDYTLDVNNPNKIKKCILDESAILRHAYRFPKVRAIVYQTYSKNSAENELLVSKHLEEFNENRKSLVYPYKISPPVVLLTAEDIQSDEVVKDFKFLQFKPSKRMNGSFIALMTRDRDANIEREEHLLRRAKKQSAAPAQSATFEEKNFLKSESVFGAQKSLSKGAKSKQKLTTMRRKSLITSKKTNPMSSYNTLEQEIKQLQLRNQLDLPLINPSRRASNSSGHSLESKSKIIISTSSSNLNALGGSANPGSGSSSSSGSGGGVQQSSLNNNGKSQFFNTFENRLAQIGKLDAKKIEHHLQPPNRSSTPDENQVEQFKHQYHQHKSINNTGEFDTSANDHNLQQQPKQSIALTLSANVSSDLDTSRKTSPEVIKSNKRVNFSNEPLTPNNDNSSKAIANNQLNANRSILAANSSQTKPNSPQKGDNCNVNSVNSANSPTNRLKPVRLGRIDAQKSPTYTRSIKTIITSLNEQNSKTYVNNKRTGDEDQLLVVVDEFDAKSGNETNASSEENHRDSNSSRLVKQVGSLPVRKVSVGKQDEPFNVKEYKVPLNLSIKEIKLEFVNKKQNNYKYLPIYDRFFVRSVNNRLNQDYFKWKNAKIYFN